MPNSISVPLAPGMSEEEKEKTALPIDYFLLHGSFGDVHCIVLDVSPINFRKGLNRLESEKEKVEKE